ncbi:hypothetical protein JW978_03090 [Candidatus Dojkabacteria bacterium]|nr:hypothetical protein [Candidatus Dojkabacteria bacterium]
MPDGINLTGFEQDHPIQTREQSTLFMIGTLSNPVREYERRQFGGEIINRMEELLSNGIRFTSKQIQEMAYLVNHYEQTEFCAENPDLALSLAKVRECLNGQIGQGE